MNQRCDCVAAAHVEQLREALLALVNTSAESYFLRQKPKAQYDEYDTLMAPLWEAARRVLAETQP